MSNSTTRHHLSNRKRMRHFYKHVLSGLVFWLLLSQSLSVFNSAAAASIAEEETAEDEFDSQEDDVEGSEGRNFGDFLRIVKREISEGETGRSSSGIFNTTLAFTIPLFSFTLPDRATAGKDYTKQAALSLFGLALVGGITVIPYVWAASKGSVGKKTLITSSGRANNDNDAASSMLPLLVNLASMAGFDSTSCVQRSVCETYRDPDRYGYLVLPVRYFMLSSKTEDNKPTAYELAADYGREGNDVCERRFRCAFSLIGAANFLASFFFPQKSA